MGRKWKIGQFSRIATHNVRNSAKHEKQKQKNIRKKIKKMKIKTSLKSSCLKKVEAMKTVWPAALRQNATQDASEAGQLQRP